MPPPLATLAAELPSPLTVVDVGCRFGPGSVWGGLPNVRVIGFDPDEEECARLQAEAGDRARFVPVALGARSGSARLHLTEHPACASLFPPDERLVRERPALGVVRPVGETEIALRTLDDWAAAEGVEAVDLVKVDVQGSELDVLRGAERMLATTRIVEAEVEFNPIYVGQPLFGDVDAFLRERGFVLWRLSHLAHYDMPGGISRQPTAEVHWYDVDRPVQFTGSGGQLFWADAFFVRRELAFPEGSVPWAVALGDAVLAGALGFWDLARQAAAAAAGAPRTAASALSAFVDGWPA